MGTEHYFDINQINRIEFYPEQLAHYQWVDAKPAKKAFFGLITTAKATPAGFIDRYGDVYSEEQLIKYGYTIRRSSEDSQSQIYEKPYIRAYLTHDSDCLYQKFETDSLAKEWINELITRSDKKFNTIINN